MFAPRVFYGGIRVGVSSMDRLSACMGYEVVGFVVFWGLLGIGF